MESCVSNPQIKQDQLKEEEIYDLQNDDLNPRWSELKPFLLDGKWGFMNKDLSHCYWIISESESSCS
jgi:hypothetical protein